MIQLSRGLLGLLIVSMLFVWGCSSSEETQSDESTPPAPVVEKKVEKTPAKETPKETAAEQPKEQPKEQAKEPTEAPVRTAPSENTSSVTSGMPSGKFSVQIGAYGLGEKAQQIAAAARSRFSQKVYLVHDEKTGNTKVLVGDFSVKDDARRFRDQIIQQYDEYKGAWVFEVPQH